MPDYSLTDLAKLANVTPRTIRFYISQGLLPSPEQQGPRTTYTDEHLERLLAIKRLQAAHLPLADIRRQFHAAAPDEFARLAEAAAPAQSTAVDYIHEILARRPAATTPSAPSMPALQANIPPQPAPPAPPEPERSQWERVGLTPDIELHIRRPLTRGDNKRVYRLIEIARQLFEEE